MQSRKIVAFVLSVIMMLSVPLITVNAAEYEIQFYTETLSQNGLSVSNGSSDSLKGYLGSDYDNFVEYLKKELINCTEQINVYSYNLPYTAEVVDAVADLILNGLPEVFHVSAISIGYYGSSFYFIKPNYQYTKAQYTTMCNAIESASSAILTGVKGNSSLTDVQKALLIHDRLAVHCEYEYQNYLDEKLTADSYSVYGALVKKQAVCEGYAKAYMYLLDKVGIDSYICSSSQLKHAWNIVEIDGKYYHVDVTWDDPVWDISGRVEHTYFMLSTYALKTVDGGAHSANDFDTTPTSTAYDDFFWKNSETAFQLIGNNLYYLDNNSQYIRTYSGSNLCSVSDKWTAGGGYWIGNFSCLSSDGEDLFFTKSDAVYKYDIATEKTEKIFTPTHSFGSGYSIYGFKYDNSNLICEMNSTPVFSADTKNKYTVIGKYTPAQTDDKNLLTVKTSSAGAGDNSSTKIDFYKKGSSAVAYSVEVSGSGEQKASLPQMNSGVYTVVVSKKNHVARSYECTIGSDFSELKVQINLIGDINGDGKVNTLDVARANAHAKGVNSVTGYEALCVDVSNDGKINTIDVSKMNAHAKGVLKLW